MLLEPTAMTYPFTLPPLPYAYNALEPIIGRRTMHFHHDKHMQAYVDNLNKALAPYPAFHNWTLEQLLTNLSDLPAEIRTAVRNNAGGVYNHLLYFDGMSGRETRPSPLLRAAIADEFGSYKEWKSKMKEAGMGVFGSGWAWLVLDDRGRLAIVQTPNQDVPHPLRPLLLVDVWEHAYYLQYQNLRANYLDAWFRLINWPLVEKRYLELLKNTCKDDA